MLLQSLSTAAAMLVLSQAAFVQANHYQPRMEQSLENRGTPFYSHINRARDGLHRTGSLRKRCTRKSSSQIAISNDDNDNGSSEDSGSSSTGSNNNSTSTSTSSRTKTSSSKVSTGNSTAHSGSWLKKNCVTWGWITDDGDHSHGSTGSLETPAQINSAVGTDAQYFGAYAHIQGDEYKQGKFKHCQTHLIMYLAELR